MYFKIIKIYIIINIMEYLDCDKTLIVTLINDLRKKIKELEDKNNELEKKNKQEIKIIDNLTIGKMKLEEMIKEKEKKILELEEKIIR